MSSNENQPTTRLAASSIDQLTLSYLRGEISFQEYETMIENQHLMAIASANLSQHQHPSSSGIVAERGPHIVSSTIELTTSGGEAMETTETSASTSAPDLDRFFSLEGILDDEDEEEEEDDEDETDYDVIRAKKSSASKSASREDVGSMMVINDDTTMSQWNDFDIETLNFDKFIKDHQTENSKAAVSPTKASKSNKRKRDGSEVREGGLIGASGSSARMEDPNELRAKRRVIKILFLI